MDPWPRYGHPRNHAGVWRDKSGGYTTCTHEPRAPAPERWHSITQRSICWTWFKPPHGKFSRKMILLLSDNKTHELHAIHVTRWISKVAKSSFKVLSKFSSRTSSLLRGSALTDANTPRDRSVRMRFKWQQYPKPEVLCKQVNARPARLSGLQSGNPRASLWTSAEGCCDWLAHKTQSESSKLTCRHIEISGAPLPLTDTGTDHSQGAKGGRIWTDLSLLAKLSLLRNDATLNVFLCSLTFNFLGLRLLMHYK